MRVAAQQDEATLARAAARGDVTAFSALVRFHEAAVRRLLARLVRGDGSDDLAQEVFLKAWRTAGHWRGEGSYKAWLMGIAWGVFLSFHRARSRRDAREQSAPPPQPSVRADVSIDIARALAALDEGEQAAALLCFGEGFSHVEAAGIMDIPLGTLKSIVARARVKLVCRLEPEHA